MKPSTAVELVGFACLTVAAFLVDVRVGFLVAGFVCIFIGYGTDDRQAGLSVDRMTAPFRSRWQARRAKRAAKAKSKEK